MAPTFATQPIMPPADPTPESRSPRSLSIRQKVLLGFGLAIVGVIVVSLVAYRSTRRFIARAESVAHTRLVVEGSETLLRHLMESESAARGYIITGDDRYLQACLEADENARSVFERLQFQTVDDPVQRARLGALEAPLLRKLHTLKEFLELRLNEGREAAIARFSSGEGEKTMQETRTLINEFEQAVRTPSTGSGGLSRTVGRTTIFLLTFSSGFTLVLLGVAVVIILKDIQARERAEELLAQERNLLRRLIDTIPEQIYVKDLHGRFILDNVEHRKFLKVREMDEVAGKTVFYFFPQELAALYHADDQSVIQSGTPVLNREEPAVTPDRKLTWLATTKVPLEDTNGAPIGLVCVSRDISERKAAEEKLRVFAAQLEQSNDELRDFAGVASHDLQEPLRKIQTFSDRLQAKCSEEVGEAGRDYLNRIQNAASRMQTLIQDLLVLSRVSSKAQRFVEIDLGQIIGEVLSDLEVRIEQSGAKIEVGFLPKIEADPVQMRQLFQNLLSNALKFQKPGQRPEVILSGKVLEVQDHHLPGAAPGDEVCQIMIKDNGIGFEEQYVEQIFSLFQRLHSRSEYEGTGIGLAVCRKILHRHGGSITAKSAKGQGATFIVMLPLHQITNP